MRVPVLLQMGERLEQPNRSEFSGRATDPDRRTSVPRPAVTAGGGGQVQRTGPGKSTSRARAAGWLARWLASWLERWRLESLASHPVTLCWCFCSLYSHTSYGLAFSISPSLQSCSCPTSCGALSNCRAPTLIRLTSVTYNPCSSDLSYVL